MKLASICFEGRELVAARLDDDHLVDLAEVASAFGREAPPGDMLALIEAGATGLEAARELVELARERPDPVRRIPAAAVAWRPPVRAPGKILGVALNNSASDARKISAPDHPMFFMKPRTCLIGHGEDIVVRPYYGTLHPEPELAIVVGRRGRDLDPRTALDWVFGYTIFNDVTGAAMRAEDRVHYWALYPSADDPTRVERREQHLSYAARYKGTDGFGPAGPSLVTRDEVPDPHALNVTCSLAGVVVAEDSTRYLSFTVPEVLAFISRFMTLEPGDMISMGTAFRPSAGSGRSLHTADLSRFDGPVEITITGLGTLVNGVRRENPDLPAWRLPKSAARGE